MSEEIFKEEKVFKQQDVENERLRKEESENEQLRKNNVVKDATIKEPLKIKSPEEDKNATYSYPNWFDKNKFKKTLAIIDSDTFNYRHKIGKFRYTEIKDFIKLEIIQFVKYLQKRFKYIKQNKKWRNKKNKKTCTTKQKELLNLFNDLLDTISIDKTLESKSQEDNENENKNEM